MRGIMRWPYAHRHPPPLEGLESSFLISMFGRIFFWWRDWRTVVEEIEKILRQRTELRRPKSKRDHAQDNQKTQGHRQISQTSFQDL